MENGILEDENNIIHVKVQQVRNKKVTKIDNVPDQQKDELLKLLKKKLACGGSINELGAIVLQGDKTHTELIKILKEQCEGRKIEMNGKIN